MLGGEIRCVWESVSVLGEVAKANGRLTELERGLSSASL